MEQSLKKFRDSVDHAYSGQEDSINAVSKALMGNMMDAANFYAGHTAGERGVQRPRPLLLHFTGPTGETYAPTWAPSSPPLL